ncbi:prepilin peptidase [Corallincola luteus]|uniref:Prepilin leader peptidase/N-methyltransferase n=1 Tax=Corallincola luteus TaxID=1775177 RepID=A0ABY2APZ1_9GAMM|nr:A24 family peptidase [Corallincola luteus]TCI03601.1 prepilin peptidase [Corallincola luteus]
MLKEFILLFELYPAAYWLLVAVMGLLIGSFLNVVIHRMPLLMERQWRRDIRESYPEATLPDNDIDKLPTPYNLVVPRSACPHCGHQITALENIPVVSWLLLLRGKCSQCKAAISKRYPAIELLTGVLSGYVAWQFSFTAEGIGALLFLWLLLPMIFIDIDKMLLPDQLTYPLLWLGLLFNLDGTFVSLNDAVIGAVAGYLALWSVYWGFKLLTGKEGMGYGDFKLLAGLGAWLGWQQLPLIILLSAGVGAVLGITMIMVQGRDKAQPMPFGPYLAIAGFIALLWGEQITQWYLMRL